MIKQIMCLAYEWPGPTFTHSLLSLLYYKKRGTTKTRRFLTLYSRFCGFLVRWNRHPLIPVGSPLTPPIISPSFLAAASRSDGYKRPISELIWFWKIPSPKPSKNDIDKILAWFGATQDNASVPRVLVGESSGITRKHKKKAAAWQIRPRQA